LTGNARRALSSDQMTNNQQLVSTGQAAFVAAMKSEEEFGVPPGIVIGRVWKT
jgi:hypothetical protein